MFWTRNWGYVSSREELAMLNRAERHLKQKKKPTVQRLPVFKTRKNK